MHTHHHSTPEHKSKSVLNFKKARSLLDTMIEMVETDAYCMDVMQQNLAVIGLLKSAHQTLMEGHLKSCFAQAVTSSNEKRKSEMVKEILTVTTLANK